MWHCPSCGICCLYPPHFIIRTGRPEGGERGVRATDESRTEAGIGRERKERSGRMTSVGGVMRVRDRDVGWRARGTLGTSEILLSSFPPWKKIQYSLRLFFHTFLNTWESSFCCNYFWGKSSLCIYHLPKNWRQIHTVFFFYFSQYFFTFFKYSS